MMFSYSAWSQRVVGNGGGLIENQIVYVWLDLENVLNKCFKSDCALPDEKKFLQDTFRLLSNKKIDISFYSEEQNLELSGRLYLLKNEDLIFNTTALYSQYKNLSTFTLADSLYLILAPFSNSSFSNFKILQLAQKVYSSVSKNESNYFLSSIGLPDIQFKLISDQLFINDKMSLRSLVPFVYKFLPCPKPQVLKFKNLSIQGLNKNKQQLYVSSKIQYSCQSISYMANIFMSLKIINQSSVDLDNSSLQLQPLIDP
jgi:hypothetical protein